MSAGRSIKTSKCSKTMFLSPTVFYLTHRCFYFIFFVKVVPVCLNFCLFLLKCVTKCEFEKLNIKINICVIDL